jgi:hypothetical protein
MSSYAGPHTAFFYGTLMAPKVLHRVCRGPANPSTLSISNSLTIRPALLKLYRRHRVKNADYPAIIPHNSSTVRGTLVQGLTDGDIWRLDIFEGDEYERKKVKVRVITDNTSHEPTENQLGEEFEAESYIWIAGEHQLEDSEWDFDEFMREKMVFWAGEEGETREDMRGEFDLVNEPKKQYFEPVLSDDGVEVDKAVEAQQRDPMGGRGLNGDIGRAVEESQGKEKEILRSAV